MYFFAHAFDVGQGHLFERRLVGLEIVCRIAVELQTHAFGQHLLARVVAEEERVEDVVLGAFQFFLGEGLFAQTGYLCQCCLGCVHGGGALGQHHHTKCAGMVIIEAEPAADGVRKSEFGAHLLEEPAAEAAAENLVHDGERWECPGCGGPCPDP